MNTVNYEITDESSEMTMTWGEYIGLTMDKSNERYAKSILLHLSKHPDRNWTAGEVNGYVSVVLNNPLESAILIEAQGSGV